MGVHVKLQPENKNTNIPCMLYLSVYSSYDSCAYIHAGNKTVLKVMVEDESLQESCEEHEEGQCVTPPVRNTLLFCERDQQPRKVTRQKSYQLY